jgi:hypothetical protein
MSREFTYRITGVTKKVLNSSAEERLYHPDSPARPGINPLSFSHRSGSSTPMDFHSEDVLTEKNNAHRWTRRNSSKPSRTSFAPQQLRATADR